MITINESVILKCGANNRQAQNELYEIVKPRIYSIIKNRSKTIDDAEIITSLAMTRIYQCIHQFQFMGSFEGWCISITKHAIYDFYRKKDNQVLSIDGFIEKYPIYGMDYLETKMQNNPSVNDGFSDLVISEYFNLIKQLLTPREYTIFMLYYEGYNHKEIGKMLSISEGTSKWHTHHARTKLINNEHFKKLKI